MPRYVRVRAVLLEAAAVDTVMAALIINVNTSAMIGTLGVFIQILSFASIVQY